MGRLGRGRGACHQAGHADPEQARATGVPVRYYLFDVWYAAGYDMRQLPLWQRKQVLRRLLDFRDPVRLDEKAREGARRLGLPASPDRLSRLVPPAQLAPFAAALVRVVLDRKVADQVGSGSETR